MSDAEDVIVCYICNLVESDSTRILECAHCCKSAHFKCLKIIGNAVSKAKKKPFFCTVVCAEIHAKSTSKQSGYDDVIKELRLLTNSIREVKQESTQTRSILEETRNQIKAVAETNRSIEESQAFLAEKFDDLLADFNDLKEKQANLMGENKIIRKEMGQHSLQHQLLTEKVDGLEVELDKLRRESLSKNVVILGLPFMENEDVRSLVRKVGVAVGCAIPAEDIVDARRINGRNPTASVPPVLATFRTNHIKEQLFECKRKHGMLLVSNVDVTFVNCSKRVTIRDELTAFGKGLLDEARKLQQDLGIKYVWPGRNGSILLKRSDGAKIESIRSRLQLQALTKTVQKRVLNLSSSSAESNSSPIQPQPKKQNVSRK